MAIVRRLHASTCARSYQPLRYHSDSSNTGGSSMVLGTVLESWVRHKLLMLGKQYEQSTDSSELETDVNWVPR